MNMPVLTAVSCGLAVLASGIAATTDSRTGHIPNWLTLPIAAFGVVLHAALAGRGSAGVSLLGLLLAAAVPLVLYTVSHRRAIGGGDVKLLAALGALLGPTLGLEVQFGAFVLLAVFALIQLAFRGQLLGVLGNSAGLLVNPFLPPKWRRNIRTECMTEMRMGPAIAISVIATLVAEHLNLAEPWPG